MEIRINYDPISNSVKMLFFTRQGNDIIVVRPVKFEFERIGPQQLREPTFVFGHEFGDNILEDLASAIASEGIKTETDAKIQGTLDATREHLADMQKLVFEKRIK